MIRLAIGVALSAASVLGSACTSSDSDAMGCPSAPPASGAECSSAASCPYGPPCDGTVAVCAAGHWAIGASTSSNGQCPAIAPERGASCSLCETTSCDYNPTCEADGGTAVIATCAGAEGGAVWGVTATFCATDGGDGSLPDAADDGGDHHHHHHRDASE